MPLHHRFHVNLRHDLVSASPLSGLGFRQVRGVDMSEFRHSVAEFIRAGNKLLEAKDELHDDEENSVRDMLWRLSVMFPDEGDDAAD